MQRVVIDLLGRRRKAEAEAAAAYAALLGKDDAALAAGDVEKLEKAAATLGLNVNEVRNDAQALNTARHLIAHRPDLSMLAGLRVRKEAASERMTTTLNAVDATRLNISKVEMAPLLADNDGHRMTEAGHAANHRRLADLKASLPHQELEQQQATAEWSNLDQELKAAEQSRREGDEELRKLLLAHPRIVPALTLPADFHP